MVMFPDLLKPLECLSEIFKTLFGRNQGLNFKPVNGASKREYAE